MATTYARYGTANSYGADELMDDVRKEIWSELKTKKPIDIFRRNLQKTHVEALINLINPQQVFLPPNLPRSFALLFGGDIKNTDIPSIARANLVALRAEIIAAIPATTDKLSKYHLQDVVARIKEALEPVAR